MKINITKVGAARSQLIEAINLFFEERDPVSIHTLVGAALQILNDHVDRDEVWKTDLILHYNSIYIKDEFRKEWFNSINEARNFFKHADKDLKDGRISIEFETKLNEFNIFESIRCLKIIEGNNYVNSIEFIYFTGWFILKYPKLFSEEIQNYIVNKPDLELSFNNWRQLISQEKAGSKK